MGEKKERLIYIDILRVLAMFPVITCHYTRSLESNGVGFVNKILPDTFFNVYLGSFGVAIFFVLSGASLMYTYAGEFKLTLYLKKRFLGIYPMYWMAWLLAFLYYFYKNTGVVNPAPVWKLVYTVLGMDGYLGWYGTNYYLLGEWFLGCLILLYMLFPIIKKGIENKPVITAVIIILVYFLAMKFNPTPIPDSIFFLCRVPEFAFGMYFVHYGSKVKWYVAFCSIAFLTSTWFVDYSGLTNETMVDTAVGITSVLAVAWGASYIKKLTFIVRGCQWIGKYSYAVFLVHHVLIMELAMRFRGKTLNIRENFVFYTLYLVLTFFMAWALEQFNRNVLAFFKGKKVPSGS